MRTALKEFARGEMDTWTLNTSYRWGVLNIEAHYTAGGSLIKSAILALQGHWHDWFRTWDFWESLLLSQPDADCSLILRVPGGVVFCIHLSLHVCPEGLSHRDTPLHIHDSCLFSFGSFRVTMTFTHSIRNTNTPFNSKIKYRCRRQLQSVVFMINCIHRYCYN